MNDTDTFRSLSPLAREYACQIHTGGHLTQQQYEGLLSDADGGPALRELVSAGLLVSLRGFSEAHLPERVYWFDPALISALAAAIEEALSGDRPLTVQVKAALARVGYPQPWLAARRP